MQNEFKALLKKDIYAILDGDTKLKVKIVEEGFFVKVKHFVKRKVDIRMNIKIPLEIGRQFTL